MKEQQNNEFNSVENPHEINTKKILDDISVTNETTIEIKPAKQIITKRRAYWFLACVVGWIFIFILSVIFGSHSIWQFVGGVGTDGQEGSALLGFINEVKKEGTDAGLATKYFFQALAFSFEAALFMFFILYSVKMSIKNSWPYWKWFQSTQPLRQKNELLLLKVKHDITKQAAANNGISYRDKIYSYTEIKKEISARKRDIRSLNNKIKKFNKK